MVNVGKLVKNLSKTVLFGGVLGLVTFAKDIYIGRLFGFSTAIKEYLVIMLVPVLLINSAGGAMISSYTPFIYDKKRHLEGLSVHQVSLFIFKNSAPIVVFILLFLQFLLAIGGIDLLNSLKGPHGWADFILVFFFVLVSTYSRAVIAAFMVYEKYLLATFAQGVVPVFICVALFIHDYSFEVEGVKSLIVATAIAHALQAMVCYYYCVVSNLDRRPKVRIDLGGLHLKFIWVLFSALVLASYEFIEVVFAAKRSDADVALVNYASRIFTLVAGLIMVASGNIMTFGFIDYKHSGGAIKSVLPKILLQSAMAGLFVGSVAYFLLPLFLGFFYAESSLTTAQIASISSYTGQYALALPFVLISFVSGRILIAEGRQAAILAGSVIAVIFSLTFNFIFLRMNLSSISIIYASLIGYGASSIFLACLLYWGNYSE